MNVIGEGSVRVGVLALQGDFALHARALARCGSASRDRSTGEASPSIIGVEAVEIRKPDALEDVAGLIIPGGESTTLLKLMGEWEFVPAIEKFHTAGKPIFGTCAASSCWRVRSRTHASSPWGS